ncbi:MAG: Tim44 domain-containing protein [Deltaproteobacteria bacterium]|nr:Tim44 domain-containing protein [Deltaproteobacteria bacterium]
MHVFRRQAKGIHFGTGIVAVALICGLATLAEARVGGGRSMGSRGSRSFSAPAPPSTPSPGNAFGQRSAPPSSYGQPYSQRAEEPFSRPTPFPQSSPYGGFWRSVGGGLLGGFLGSMLFRSLGFGGYGGYGGYGGGGWGGPGLFDLLLLGLLGYVAYRFFFNRAARPERYEPTPSYDVGRGYDRYPAQEPVVTLPSPPERDLAQGIAQLRVLDPGFDPVRFCDQAMDFFFRLQAAWSARDLSPLRSLVTNDLIAQLQADVDQLKREGKVNHVENIAVRTTELTEAWQETGQDFATVYFYANCLDYDVNESTGEVVRGSKLEPSKFEEYWTFTRPAGSGPWKLSAINQA